MMARLYRGARPRRPAKRSGRSTASNKTRSYVTPIIREIDGRTQMILSGSKCVHSYDPHDGRRHWVMDGPTEQFVASMVYNGELLFLTAGFPEHHILAIKPDGQGQIADEANIVWRTTKGCSYVPSPIVVGDYFLVAADEGIGQLLRRQAGERSGWSGSASTTAPRSSRPADWSTSSPTTASRKSSAPATELDVVAENDLGEYCYASPAISQGQIFLRGEKHLYCIGQR